MRIAVLLLVLGLSIGMAMAEPGPLSANDRQHLLHDQFTPVATIQAFPKTIRVKLDELRGTSDGMANPGGDFAAGCTSAGKPRARMILGGINKEYCLLFYENGGIAHSYNIALFSLKSTVAEYVWQGGINYQVANQIKTLKDLQDALAKQQPD
ncbi:MAG: hypothetical protein K2W82_16090 [Candidatus Obscuribacterales bacterium]|nr:hypothetical protein [Candidatus Obscuribacterales bacterium]